VEYEAGYAYELAHDCLIDEIRLWINPARMNAAHIHAMLKQGLVQHDQYRLLLDAEQLEIVKQQLKNPYLNLEQDARRFLLTSAIAAGTDMSAWLELAGAPGLEWMREIQRDSERPDSLRLAAAEALGQVEDQVTWAELEAAAQASSRLPRTYTLRALAHFMHHSRKAYPISHSFWLPVRRHLAALRLRDNRQNVSALGLAAGLAGIVGVLVTASNQVTKLFAVDRSFGVAAIYSALVLLVFSAAAFLLTWFMGSIMAGAKAILLRRPMLVQAMGLSILGSAVGLLAFLPVLFGPYGWATGAVIGVALACSDKTVLQAHRPIRIAFPILIGALSVLACLGAMILSGTFQKQVRPQDIIPTLLAAGLFATMIIRQAMRLKFSYSLRYPAQLTIAANRSSVERTVLPVIQLK